MRNEIVLAGEVAGVMTADPTRHPDARLIPLVTPATLPEIANLLGGSRGTDVTGGMAAKVAEMAALLQTAPTINVIHIISGLEPGLVRKALTDAATGGGTRIVRDASNDEAPDPWADFGAVLMKRYIIEDEVYRGGEC